MLYQRFNNKNLSRSFSSPPKNCSVEESHVYMRPLSGGQGFEQRSTESLSRVGIRRRALSQEQTPGTCVCPAWLPATPPPAPLPPPCKQETTWGVTAVTRHLTLNTSKTEGYESKGRQNTTLIWYVNPLWMNIMSTVASTGSTNELLHINMWHWMNQIMP